MMQIDSLFLAAAQSGLLLGLIHGINPCGHSWLVLAPFVAGEKNGKKVASLTLAFLTGTALACLVLGFTLGTVSSMIPESVIKGLESVTSAIIILIGAVLLIKPQLIHHHDHHHGDGEAHHTHCHDPESCGGHSLKGRFTVWALFTVGFVNMIIPCPTVAVMYKYAIESGNHLKSVVIFGLYALTTGIAVSGVIYAIYKITDLASSLEKEWVEKTVMRTAGVITVVFGTYSFTAL